MFDKFLAVLAADYLTADYITPSLSNWTRFGAPSHLTWRQKRMMKCEDFFHLHYPILRICHVLQYVGAKT